MLIPLPKVASVSRSLRSDHYLSGSIAQVSLYIV